jgi:hypothetical protein
MGLFLCLQYSSGGGSGCGTSSSSSISSGGGGRGLTNIITIISINAYTILIRKFLHKITFGKTT